ncbi:MAG TPA: MoxR family ATPase [Pyrinomonadaceae bacterium]|jgi:MoxR-like ATPase|nr:MoxR family ATPase [Pyrinomonadaceae bacterium]
MRDWITSAIPELTAKPPTDKTFSLIEAIRQQVENVIRGKPEPVRLALVALFARGHLLIEDVPGIGKTTLASALGRALELSVQRIQFTSDLLPSDVLGVSVFNPADGGFVWKPGPIFANIVLADEINRATPKTQSALLEAMAEEQVTVDGISRPLPKPFIVAATQNPSEYHGTYPLPESQLDRFLLRIKIGYPSKEDEKQILIDRTLNDPLKNVQPVASAEDILEIQAAASSVRVDEALLDYLLSIVAATRESEAFELGVSPRGALALFRSAQALALVEGRDYCIADDIKRLVIACFAHRVIVNSRISTSRVKNKEAENALNEILGKIPVPI